MQSFIVSNLKLSEKYFKIRVRLPQPVSPVLPGQFFMIRPTREWDPLLPRPFSVYRTPAPGEVEFLYKTVGRGTNILSAKRAGDDLDLLGPLGNAFPMPRPGEAENIFLVGGGIGVAPLVILSEALQKERGKFTLVVFIGGRKKEDVLCVEDFETFGTDIIVTTQDGSMGKRGTVTEALDDFLSLEPGGRRLLYACGPHPMLHRMASIVSRQAIPSYFSLESVMACGFGICMGCAEKARDGGYPLVCQEGPVFRPEQIQWDTVS